METDIFFIRHGETEWNKKLIYQGQTDIDLNETGYKQARLLSERLTEREIDRFYTSDLKRASNTASIIAEPHNKKLIKEENLREISFGDWEGMNFTEIQEKEAEKYNEWRKDPISVSPPNGENFLDFQKRVISIINKIKDLHTGERIAIVAHGGTIRVYLAHILGMELKGNRKLSVHNTSISHLTIYDNRPVLKLMNSTCHLS